MRMVIEVGFQKILLHESADTNAILQAFAGAIPVELKSEEYGKPCKYLVKKECLDFPSPVFITESQVITEDIVKGLTE